jgi:hypothetical protein
VTLDKPTIETPILVSHILCIDSLHQSQANGNLNLLSLVPILMDLWVECVADALVSVHKITNNKPLTICNVVLQLLNMLWRGLGSDDSRKAITDGSRSHILGHFPFGKGCTVARDAEKVLGEMNICFAELLSQFSGGSKGRMSEFLLDLFTWKNGWKLSALRVEQLTRSYPVVWSVVTGYGEDETKVLLVDKVLAYFGVVGSEEISELFEFVANVFRVCILF